jgi:hypothetical protein
MRPAVINFEEGPGTTTDLVSIFYGIEHNEIIEIVEYILEMMPEDSPFRKRFKKCDAYFFGEYLGYRYQLDYESFKLLALCITTKPYAIPKTLAFHKEFFKAESEFYR